MAKKAKKVVVDGVRLFGQEFLDAEDVAFKKLPKRHHAMVRDLLNKLQLWDLQVFLNIQVGQEEARRTTAV